MKRTWFIFGLALLFAFNVSAQSEYAIKQAIDFFHSNKMQRGDWRKLLTESDIEGSPYLNDEFIKGSVYTTSKTRFVDVPLRYNIYSEQIEFLSGDNTVQALAAPEVIEKIEFGKYELEYVPYLNLKKIRRGFFIVLEKGNATLYSLSRVLFVEAKPPAGYQDAQPPKFVKKQNEYYIRIGKEPAQQVTKVKDLGKIFTDHKKEIAAFIKSNKIKTNKPETLIKLVQFYNNL